MITELLNFMMSVISSSILFNWLSNMYYKTSISILSAELKSNVTVEVSIKIMNIFVEMRNFSLPNRKMFARLDRVELK